MGGERAERRLAAILAADVVGYSRLMGADEEGTLRRLKALRAELIDPKLAEHKGRLVKTTGDGLLAEFASIVDALRCAAEVQAETTARNGDVLPTDRIEFRVGIHQGDIIFEDGDIFGNGVNIAARLEALAEPGGICVSARVQEDAAGKLDLAFRDIGEQQLRNIARPVRAYMVGAAANPSQHARQRWHSGALAVTVGVAVAVAAIAAGGWWVWSRSPARVPSHSAPAAAQINPAPRLSIVVLPFANLSGDPGQGYFADGITEDLTTDLSRIRNLMVIARNTAFTYRDKAVDARQIGRELGVRYLLEGSIQRAGSQVRINAQLIDAETGAHLWAERFDREITDLFAMQNEITARIANALGWELIGVEAGRSSSRPDALDLILRGRAAQTKGMFGEPLARAIGFYDAALALDPESVEARGRLADALTTRAIVKKPADADLRRAEDLIAQVLAISPQDPIAHLAKGKLLRLTGGCGDAIPEFEAALAANRNDSSALQQLGSCKYLTGSPDREAISLFKEAIRLSPRDPAGWVQYMWIGIVNLMASRTDEAIEWLEKARTAGPKLPPPHFFLPPPTA